MTKNPSKIAYFRGTFYDSIEKFRDAVDAFQNSTVNKESFHEMMAKVTHELELNLFSFYQFEFKNHQMAEILLGIKNFVMDKAFDTKPFEIHLEKKDD